jgi:WD40 repeat protein
MIAAGTTKLVRFWDAFSGKQIGSFRRDLCDTHIFQPDGRGLIVVDCLEGVCQCALERMGDPASSAYRLGKPRPLYKDSGLYEGALSRNGRYFVCAHESEGESLVLDLKNPSAKPVVLRPDPMVDRCAISPDGHWVATASWHTSLVKVWDARAGELVRTLSMPGRTLPAFSPDGHWLATSTSEYQLWEVGSWRPKGPPKPGCDVPQANFTAFSPDGQVMARMLDGTEIQLLETFTERPLATLEAPGSIGIGRFQFSPDGSHLAAMQLDHQVQLWDLRLIRRDLKEMHLDWDMPPISAEQAAEAVPVTLEIETDLASQTEPIASSGTNNPVEK